MQVTTSLKSVERFWLAPPKQDKATFAADHLNDIEKKILLCFADYISIGFATALYKHFFMNGMERKIQDLRDMGQAVASQMDSYKPGFLGVKVKIFSVDCMMNGQRRTLTYVQTENDVEISLDHDSSFCVVIKKTNFIQMRQSLLNQKAAAATESVSAADEETNIVEVKNNSVRRCDYFDSEDSDDEDSGDDALLEKLKNGMYARSLKTHAQRAENPNLTSPPISAYLSDWRRDEMDDTDIDQSKNYLNQIPVIVVQEPEQHNIPYVDSRDAMEELGGQMRQHKLMRQFSLPDNCGSQFVENPNSTKSSNNLQLPDARRNQTDAPDIDQPKNNLDQLPVMEVQPPLEPPVITHVASCDEMEKLGEEFNKPKLTKQLSLPTNLYYLGKQSQS